MTALLSRPRLILGLAVLLSITGGFAWFSMAREEDPRLADRFAQVISVSPGADVEQIERLVVEPLEDELAQIDQLLSVKVTIRASVAVFVLELRGEVTDTQTAWDDIADALARGHENAPEATQPPVLTHELNETESVVLAVRGDGDALEIAADAESLRRALLSVPDVSKVLVTGDPGEQISVLLDETRARSLGVSPEQLAGILVSRNSSLPGGALEVGGRRVALRPRAEFATVEEISSTPIPVGDGTSIPLSALADVRRTVAEPEVERARVDGERTVMVGVVSRQEIDAVAFGEGVRAAVETFRLSHPELRIDEIAFQPEKVEARLSELGLSLALGVLIVAAVLLLTMGVRLGLLVAGVVPLVTFAALAVYAAGGGVLHQMAVAALVVSLGLLVDNAIVMAELIQQRLDEGVAPREAATSAVRELAWPLGSATATTLASFVPMLLAPGSVGEFTRAIPVVVMVSLVVSLVYAVLVTPLMAQRFLRPSKDAGRITALERGARRVATLAIAHPIVAIVAVLAIVGVSASFAPAVQKDFFPASDREQLLVSLDMPEGTHIAQTDDAAKRLERVLSARPEVRSIATVVGRSVPHFYYNLPRIPRASHLAQLVVTVNGPREVGVIQAMVRELARREVPSAVVVARRLEQGPPVPAPIEVRLEGEDLEALGLAADEVRRILRADPRTRDVRTDRGPGSPTLEYAIDDAETARRGLGRVQVASAFVGRTLSSPAGTFRGGDDPVPIVMRDPAGERMTPEMLDAIDVATTGGPIPVRELTRVRTTFTPAVIHHRDRKRVVSVLAEVADGATYAAIVADIQPALDALAIDGVTVVQGGATESSATANASLGSRGPIGALLLIAILLAQFDSFRKVGIVLFTAPLAVMGIWPGLWLLGLPFGFVALLGAIALIGIVVNGAIVLLDLTERRISEGATRDEALVDAVGKRTRPILLTTATTIAGLAPLLFSESTLWPPMAAAMISGLLISTLLTLVAVPALYRTAFRTPARA